MPELPEVETTRRGIEPHVAGKTVAQVLVRQPSLRWPVSPELSQALTGAVVDRIDRRGKYLLFCTGRGRMMVHLGMSGSLRIAEPGTQPRKHDHLDVAFSDSTLMRFHDPRRFGSVFWLPAGEGHELIDDLGPEPLGDRFDGEYLYAASRSRSTPVKTFIMNSKVVVGVGNIYANEALFLAGIRPERLAGKSRQRYVRLAGFISRCSVMQSILKASRCATRVRMVRQVISSSTCSYTVGAGTLYCLWSALKEIRLGQRTTVFCPRCQR